MGFNFSDKAGNNLGRDFVNEVESALNETVNKVDATQEQVDSIVQEAGNSNPEIVAARTDFENVDHGTLQARINAADGTVDNFGYWTPPTQPSTAWGQNGVPLTKDPELSINALYEPLRTAHPEYISRTTLGKDQSGVHNIYRYVFTPANYSKTVVLSAGTHGNEYTAFFTLWRFLYHLVNDWRKYPQLEYIRKNVRLVVLPMNNPWSFANFKRQNSRGVDLNRNTDYLWEYITGTNFQEGGTNYKGTAPFSEIETVYFKQTLEAYKEAVSSIDFHTITTVEAEHIVYTPYLINQYNHIFDNVIDWLYKPGNRIVNGTTAVPTLSCWAAYNYNCTVANPEWFNGLYGTDTRDSVEMTECLKYFGNVIIEACKLEQKTTMMNDTEPFVDRLMYDKGSTATPITLTSTIYNNLPHTQYSMKFKRQGIIRARGYIRVTLSEACTAAINPIFYQVNHRDFGYDDVKDLVFNEDKRTLQAGTHTFEIMASMKVLPFNYNQSNTSRPEDVKFRIRAKSSSGTITVESFRVELDYIQTDKGVAYKVNDFTGMEAQVAGSDFVTRYPDITKYDLSTED